MLIRTIATALVLVGACADSEESLVDPAQAVDGEILSAQLCQMPLETEGPCSLACDQDALFAYIPESFCVTFNCTHQDGSPYLVGGCNF